MTPWWWLSVLTVALPVYLVLRRGSSVWIAMAAGVAGLALGAILEGMLFAAYSLATGRAVAVADAVAHAANFPTSFFIRLVFMVAGALNPELLFSVPRVVDDILAGSKGSALRALKLSLQLFDLLATITVPCVAAILGNRAARWTVIGAGSLAIAAVRIGAGYLHYKEQGIVIISDDPPWLSAIHDVNMAIVALVQTFLQISLAYLLVQVLLYLGRQIWRLLVGSGNAGPPIAPASQNP